MKKRWNLPLWLGFAFVLVGLFTYEWFAQFPITRDLPWANLLLLAIGLSMLITGFVRAFRQPTLYRGKIAGSILTGLSVVAAAAFAYMMLFFVRQVPASTGAPHLGDRAPDFALPDQNGAVLIFYRGHW